MSKYTVMITEKRVRFEEVYAESKDDAYDQASSMYTALPERDIYSVDIDFLEV